VRIIKTLVASGLPGANMLLPRYKPPPIGVPQQQQEGALVFGQHFIEAMALSTTALLFPEFKSRVIQC
jgi:hypothetical protein